MNKFTKYLIAIVVIALVALTAIQVKANRSYFPKLVTLNGATSTSTLMTVVPATVAASSTFQLDAYEGGTTFAFDSATMLVRQLASSSASVTTITIQYSQDGIDWFQNNLAPTSTENTPNSLTFPQTYTITGASTAASTTLVALGVKTPTRYVRAFFTSGVGTSSIWAQWVPKREISNNN